MEGYIDIKTSVPVTQGIDLVVETRVRVTGDQLARAIRDAVKRSCPVGDDAGCDWFYDESASLVFIGGERGWVASKNQRDVLLLKAADLIDGSDYSAQGNGY